MEVVSIFNKELKSILECKLPVSRHKMSLITKSAMKALKFYKHVVQSVEKFIAKCSCDYKVPGLYVIDAIVRQSKHQYCDKDVFVPRFTRNIVTTFLYLSQCDPKDLQSLERVLRLWQQNGVFPTDLVEALLELVYEPSSGDKVLQAGTIVARLVNEWNAQRRKPEEKLETFMPNAELYNHELNAPKNEGGLIESITKLLTRFHAETGQDVSSEINQIQILHKKIVEQSALLAQGQMIDANTLSQLHQSMEELTKKAAKAAAVQQSKLAMLANDDKEHLNEAITDMEFVEQLQQMVDTLGQTRALQEELRQALEMKAKAVGVSNNDNENEHHSDNNNNNENNPDTVESVNINNVIVNTNNDNDVEAVIEDNDFRQELKMEETDDSSYHLPQTRISTEGDVDLRLLEPALPHNYSDNVSNNGSLAHLSNEKLSRSSSNDGSHKRKYSESESRYLKRKRSRSRDYKKKEKRSRESRKKWMPYSRKQCVGIVSKTVFIGHLHKHVSEQKLRTLCEEYGSIEEFNMIPPRGCAFVTFEKRKSAYKAALKMHELKFEGRELKVAWAPNKGVKDDKEFRDSWVEQEGCTYIHIEQFPINRISELTEGGAYLDEDSLTDELRHAIRQFEKQKAEALARGMGPSSVEAMISVAAEVANKNLPLLNTNEKPPEMILDPPFFPSHFHPVAPPPPIMPTIIPYPPPPMFISSSVPPPMTDPIVPTQPPPPTCPVAPVTLPPTPVVVNPPVIDEPGPLAIDSGWGDMSVSSAIEDPSVSIASVNSNASIKNSAPAAAVASTIISSHTAAAAATPSVGGFSQSPMRLPDAPHMVPPFLRPPGFRNPSLLMASRGRVYRHPVRYSRHPPPGFPAYRPNIISRPPAPRF